MNVLGYNFTQAKALVGLEPYQTIGDVFQAMAGVEWVVARNWESLMQAEGNPEEAHPDVDLFVKDHAAAVNAIRGVPVRPPWSTVPYKPYRVAYSVLIEQKKWNFDVRYVGDNYIDGNWMERCIERRQALALASKDTRTTPGASMYVMNSSDYFFTLLYHATVQKPTFSLDYAARLKTMAQTLPKAEADKLAISHSLETARGRSELLEAYLLEHGYTVKIPADASVRFHPERARSYASVLRGHSYERIHNLPTQSSTHLPTPTMEVVTTLPAHVSESCWNEVNWGMRRALPSQGYTRRCTNLDANHALNKHMEYCVYPKGTQIHPSGLRSKAPLHTVVQDGGQHNPQYPFEAKRVAYTCSEGERKDTAVPCGVPKRTCTRHFGETLLLSRKDDHNPFFMTSIVLNAWIMFGKTDVQLLMYDDASKQPVDDLYKKLLSPSRDIAYAHDMLDDVWCFEKLWTIPGEYTGPLMMHLNDAQECGRSDMIEDFTNDVHALYPNEERKDNRTTVTFVGRKHYNKRTISRVWTNEKDMVEAMGKARPDLHVRLVYYEELDFEKQMHVDRTTDIMVGMHGAGLVHALFLPTGSHVVEVFPKHKRRWGYRNIAQYRGFTYDDFRGGRDGAHDSKTMGVEEWVAYWGGAVLGTKTNASTS